MITGVNCTVSKPASRQRGGGRGADGHLGCFICQCICLSMPKFSYKRICVSPQVYNKSSVLLTCSSSSFSKVQVREVRKKCLWKKTLLQSLLKKTLLQIVSQYWCL